MDPTTEANKKRPFGIDLNLPPPPEDSTSGETHQDSPPPAVEAAVNSGHHQLQPDENGSDGEKEEGKILRKRRKVAKDSKAPMAEDGNDDDGGVQRDNMERWQKWVNMIKTAAWESGDDGTVDWKELMNREQPKTAGSTVRNGPQPRDEDEKGEGNSNAADQEVSGEAPSEAATGELPIATSPEVMKRKSGRIRTRPNKQNDWILLEPLPSSLHSPSSTDSTPSANIHTPRRSRK